MYLIIYYFLTGLKGHTVAAITALAVMVTIVWMDLITELTFISLLAVVVVLTTIGSDLEKVVNRPQAENSELYNGLKIAWFATKDKEKHMYKMLVWQDVILKSWLPVLNPYPINLNFEPKILNFPSTYLKSSLSNLNSQFPTLLPPSSLKDTIY